MATVHISAGTSLSRAASCCATRNTRSPLSHKRGDRQRHRTAVALRGHKGKSDKSANTPTLHALHPSQSSPSPLGFVTVEQEPVFTSPLINNIQHDTHVESTNITWHEGMVTRADRERSLSQRGVLIWFTGLSGAGKSTLACTLQHALHTMGKHAYVLDGDNIRYGLNGDLGFSAADRVENIRRIGEVAKLFVDAGLIVLASFISPYRSDRNAVRSLLPAGDFIEVYMKIPLQVCEERDAKGLYKLARAGKIKGFTGIDDPYEEPDAAEFVMEMHDALGAPNTPEHMTAHIIEYLKTAGNLGRNVV